MKTILAILLVLWSAPVWADTHAAASCSASDVQTAINAASDGDTVTIPGTGCSWSSGVTIPAGVGMTISGAGTPNATPTTFGASASCTATTITMTGGTAFLASPSYGASTLRISCLQLTYGSGASIAMRVLGTCTSSGCPNMRLDNVTFTNWSGHADAGLSYGILAIGNMFGVLDHNTITGGAATGNYLHLNQGAMGSFLGVGHYGDNSWALPEYYGTEKFLYYENNSFVNATPTEFEGTPGTFEDAGGARYVIRFNQFTNMDHLNVMAYWHGTESYGRPRGPRTYELYKNTHSCGSSSYDCIGAHLRSGTGLAWGNSSGGGTSGYGIKTLLELKTYRIWQNYDSAGFGACDGTGPYDTNDGLTYYSGTIQTATFDPVYSRWTITVNGSPGWATNAWLSAGSPYSVHNVTSNHGSEIFGNGSNTLTVETLTETTWGRPIYYAGDSIQILRATVCIDQTAGRGAGQLYTDTWPAATPVVPANQALSPTYVWDNPFVNPPTSSYVVTNTARVIRNREYYVENANQGAQTSATSPFDGTTTVGMGHGTIAFRPTTCTTGVGYWATDEGEWNSNQSGADGRLYLCTATNTWTLSYTPYVYPHPLIGGAVAAPAAPTNVRIR